MPRFAATGRGSVSCRSNSRASCAPARSKTASVPDRVWSRSLTTPECPVDRVLRYAGPILQEREHIAQEAAKAGVKRDDHGAVMLLGELVAERLEERGVPRDSMTWDAWRREDGGWEVRLEYVAGQTERSALWVYDPSRKTVTPDDDDARWLLEEGEPAAPVTHLRSVKQVTTVDHPVRRRRHPRG